MNRFYEHRTTTWPMRGAAPPCRHDGGGGGKRASPRKISYSLPAKCDNCYFPLQYLKQENATSMSFSAQSLWSLKAKMKVGHSIRIGARVYRRFSLLKDLILTH